MATYTIKSGETLSGIAKQYGTSTSELMKLNPQIKDPNLIYAGASLNLPTAPTAPAAPAPTPEQLKPFEEQIKAIQAKVPAIQTGVEELTKAGVSLPEIPYDQTKPDDKAVSGILAGAGAVSDWTTYWIERDKELQKQLTEEREKQKGFIEKLTAPPEKTREERLTELRTEYGVPEKLDLLQQQNIKVAQLRGEIDKLDIARQTEIDRAYAQAATMTGARAEVNETNRIYDSKRAYMSAQLGAEAMVLSAYQGNLDQARNLISETVDAFVWDYTEERNRWQFAYTYHTDFINSLTTEQRNIMDNAYRETVRQEEVAREEKTNLLNLMLKYPEAGIRLKDTLEEATTKASEWTATQIAPTGITPDIANRIFNQINMAVDQYRLNPEGFRERFIEGLVTQYGEPARDYISKQVYAQMPDIGKPEIPTEITELPVEPAKVYTWNSMKFHALTLPGSPTVRTAMSALQGALINYATAVSGRQMSWRETKMQYAAMMPSFLDSNETKINKIIRLENSLIGFLGAEDFARNQAEVGLQRMGEVRRELEIKEKGGVKTEEGIQTITASDGTIWTKNPDGTYTQIK